MMLWQARRGVGRGLNWKNGLWTFSLVEVFGLSRVSVERHPHTHSEGRSRQKHPPFLEECFTLQSLQFSFSFLSTLEKRKAVEMCSLCVELFTFSTRQREGNEIRLPRVSMCRLRLYERVWWWKPKKRDSGEEEAVALWSNFFFLSPFTHDVPSPKSINFWLFLHTLNVIWKRETKFRSSLPLSFSSLLSILLFSSIPLPFLPFFDLDISMDTHRFLSLPLLSWAKVSACHMLLLCNRCIWKRERREITRWASVNCSTTAREIEKRRSTRRLLLFVERTNKEEIRAIYGKFVL